MSKKAVHEAARQNASRVKAANAIKQAAEQVKKESGEYPTPLATKGDKK